MQPEEGEINVDTLHGLGYDDFDPVDSLEIPPILSGMPPSHLDHIYTEFIDWLHEIPNIHTHLGDALQQMEESLFVAQLHAFRLHIMAQFYMRHPSYEVYNRR